MTRTSPRKPVTQKTDKGLEIPVPRRSEVMRDLGKVAAPKPKG
jgi:hypothetical protein